MTEELKTILTAILNLIAESRDPGSILYVPDPTFFEHEQLIRSLIEKAQKAEIGDFQGHCETTGTPRYYNPMCRCDTYPGNLGPCRAYEVGENQRCVYCDHNEQCHLILTGMTHGESRAETGRN